MGCDLNETQILTAALITAGIGQPGGVKGLIDPKCLNIDPSTVTEYTGGLDSIDACYVAETPGSIILAFRGTLTNFDNNPADVLQSLIDWLGDLRFNLISATGFPGMVHEGFHQSVTNLSGSFIDDIRSRLARSKKQLVVTGYSKGAALAPLASWLLRSSGITVDELHIYEPPRCGDSDFAQAFNQAFPRAMRYEYQDDLVPHSPPSEDEVNTLKVIASIDPNNAFLNLLIALFGDGPYYAPVGTLQFADWSTPPNFVSDSPSLFLLRMWNLLGALASPPTPPKAVADHGPKDHLFAAVLNKYRCSCDCPTS